MRALEATTTWRPGQRLGQRYRLEALLGSGAMGAVFAASDELLGRRVAVKLPWGLGEVRAAMGERLTHEARLAAQLKGDHIVQLLDIGRLDDGTPFVVLELLEGETLREHLAREGVLPVRHAATIVIEACSALAEVHALDMVHRDVKPENLFLARRVDGSPTVKLIDFGSSTYTVGSDVARPPCSAGTPLYMAPEQFVSPDRCDARVDMWALGAVLYQLLTGVPPFDGESVGEVMQLVLSTRPVPPRRRRASIPPEVEQVVLRCLAADPADRFEDVAALAQTLAPYSLAKLDAQRVGAIARRCGTREALRHTQPCPPPPSGVRERAGTGTPTPRSPSASPGTRPRLADRRRPRAHCA